MNELYQQYLKEMGIMDKDTFSEVINSFPEIDYEIDFSDLYQDCDVDDLASCIINSYLNENTSYGVIDDVSFERKEFEIIDVESLEELNLIKNYFVGWKLRNYDELKEELEKEEISNYEDKERLRILDVFKNIEFSELKKIYDSYASNHISYLK